MHTQRDILKVNINRPVGNSEAQGKGKEKQNFGFVDNRPEANLQRKLQRMADGYANRQNPLQKRTIGNVTQSNSVSERSNRSVVSANNDIAQGEVKQFVPQGGEVCQLVEKDVKVVGTTRLVAPNPDILNGTYTKTVNDNDPVTIERSDTEESSRGPNHETADKEKFPGPYKWYRATKVREEEDTENSYILDETFVYDDKSIHLTDDNIEEGLQGKITEEGKGDIYAKAHGIGSAPQVTAAQKAYQAWLKTQYNKAQIMDLHRSVGFEYEFATYATSTGDSPGLEEHTKLGESEQISPVFDLPFILETDTDDELEAVTPPFLIADGAGAINKDAANRIYQTYRSSLKALRDGNPAGTHLTNLDFTSAGLGEGWSFTGAMRNLYTRDRIKHMDSPDRIYTQMNISLTAEEIAKFTEAYSGIASMSHKAIKTANLAILPDFQSKKERAVRDLHLDVEPAVLVGASIDNAIVNICKGLAGLVTIPSILAHNESVGQKTSLFSSVKEYCGIWLKDSIANIVDNTLPDEDSRTAMLAIIRRAKKNAKSHLLTVVNDQLETIRDGVKATKEGKFNPHCR